jgi:hypothetical protein
MRSNQGAPPILLFGQSESRRLCGSPVCRQSLRVTVCTARAPVRAKSGYREVVLYLVVQVLTLCVEVVRCFN